ncbi:Homoserine/homoserine lactone efflux protein [compost metagenome]
MSLSLLAAFWAVSLLFIISPGADWAYMISAGMRGRGVVPAAGGLLSGHLAATLIVAAGVGGIVAGTPLAMAALTLAGAGYLLWLGIGMLSNPPTPLAGDVQQKRTWSHWALKGACVSGLNPKVFLLFLALLPQFTDPRGTWSVPVQIVTLGLLPATPVRRSGAYPLSARTQGPRPQVGNAHGVRHVHRCDLRGGRHSGTAGGRFRLQQRVRQRIDADSDRR